ncbi:WD40 repeat-like protein [Polyporus arcularius HHB13444]|uniref:WD40 repeat-like protein n=1 Tax=Polyporus arcularius HHB13444 TaxID=1314778 RepID=A0A5C3PMB5_9APHY|nr:WD40 repeat-like protein [Polyporus arcularius HHB13444]
MVEGTSTLAVHRCRFVDFTPSAVTALCFPPLPLPSIKGKKAATNKGFPGFGILVVGRANGNIELCEWTGSNPRSQAPQAWVVRKTLVGPYPSKVESLALTFRSPRRAAQEDVASWSNLRLFSAGGGSELVEWDIEQGCVKRTLSSQGGPIWSISPNPASTILALGCEDGSVRLLSLQYDELNHMRRLDRVKSRILSIAWGPPVPRQTKTQSADDGSDSDDDDDEWTDSWLVTGCSDSSLRKWDFSTGRALERMSTDKIRGERTLVWAVGVLGDGTVVSGDSMGIVKFWDSRTCTQLQTFQGHAADVLCLTIGPDGTVVYTSGVDQKVTQFSYVKTSRNSTNPSPLVSRAPGRWVQSCSRRLHSHDVRALAIWPPHTPLPASHQRHFATDIAPVLVSGGLDMSVVATPAALPTATLAGKVLNPLATSTQATFEDAYHRRLAYSSGAASSSAVHLARNARLVMCTREAGLTVWRIAKRKQKGDDFDADVEGPNPQDGGWERVLDMDLTVQTNIAAGAISDDGKWIAVADWYETKLFQLTEEKNGDLKPRRIRGFAAMLQSQLASTSTGAASLIFTPDSSKLIIAASESAAVLIIDLGSSDRAPRVLRKFEQHRIRDGFVKGRVVKGRKASTSVNGDGEEDVEMASDNDGGDAPAEQDAAESSSAESDVEDSKLVHTTVTRMAVSPDGQWLATSDARRRTHVFNLDAVQHHCTLPTFPQPIHALAFDPSAPSTLVLGFADNQIEVYDVEARQFPRWARSLINTLPQRFTHLHDPVLGVTFDPGSRVEGAEEGSGSPLPPKTALFWGATWICKVILTERIGYGGFEKRRRGKRKAAEVSQPNANGRVEVSVEDGQQEVQQRNFKLVTHYRPLLLVDFVAPGELVVVERPLVDVLAKLPPAYFKPKYGAS